ncbi:MAG: hypothetical protein XD84_2178 [Desulfotomaculum sp. 46_80]|nr:MAG: hypothetical protein XD84_2178 [Desulfotomaculum sp. 46_80]
MNRLFLDANILFSIAYGSPSLEVFKWKFLLEFCGRGQKGVNDRD